MKGNLHSLHLDLAELVVRVFLFIFLINYLEPVAEEVFLVLEETLENDVLVDFQDDILAFDEG